MKRIIRITKHNKMIGIIRIMLGIIFIMTGVMKLFMEDYGEAWSIQLVEANIPLYSFTYYFVPLLELVLGYYLLIGYYTRISALIVLPIMFVAIYVHLTVTNPGAFPSQPQAPIMPLMIIVLAYLILKKGGGAWSFDYYNQSKSLNN